MRLLFNQNKAGAHTHNIYARRKPEVTTVRPSPFSPPQQNSSSSFSPLPPPPPLATTSITTFYWEFTITEDCTVATTSHRIFQSPNTYERSASRNLKSSCPNEQQQAGLTGNGCAELAFCEPGPAMQDLFDGVVPGSAIDSEQDLLHGVVPGSAIDSESSSKSQYLQQRGGTDAVTLLEVP